MSHRATAQQRGQQHGAAAAGGGRLPSHVDYSGYETAAAAAGGGASSSDLLQGCYPGTQTTRVVHYPH